MAVPKITYDFLKILLVIIVIVIILFFSIKFAGSVMPEFCNGVRQLMDKLSFTILNYRIGMPYVC